MVVKRMRNKVLILVAEVRMEVMDVNERKCISKF